MQATAKQQNKPKKPLSTVNKNLQKQQDSTKNKKKPNVRTTEYRRMEEIFLTDPDSVTREEFMLFQSAVGYRRAIQLLNEGKQRKQLRKMDGTGKTFKNLSVNKEQETTGNKEDKVIQKKKVSQATQKSTKETNQKKVSTNNTSSATSLPSGLKSGIEKLSGIDLSDVSVHKNSEKPQQVGALAYTQGNNIYMAPGQEKHLPHEGWHAVQQKQGRVAPTLQMKTGTSVNDDAGLEKEADIMGSKALKAGSDASTIQLKKSSNFKQENSVIQRITQEEAMKLAKQNTHDANTGYSWSIKAGEYNRYVFEAQDMLRDIGYNLSKRGVDGKWSPGGETYNALLKFQKTCKNTYNGLKQNAPVQTLAQVNYMQGVEPTGKLDKATHNALKKEKNNKILRKKLEDERAYKKKLELENKAKAKAKETTKDNKQENDQTDEILDGIQTAIDVIGFIPGVGDIADGVNVGISVVRKDWLGAVLSGIALIPIVGSAIAAPMKVIAKAFSKVGGAIGSVSKTVKNAIELLTKLLGGAEKVASKLSEYLSTLKGLIRKIPDLIKNVTNLRAVKWLASKKVVKTILSFAEKVRSAVETVCKKADEVFTSVKNAIFPEATVKKAATETPKKTVISETPINKTIATETPKKTVIPEAPIKKTVPTKTTKKTVIPETPKPVVKETPKPVVKETPKPVVKETPKPVVKETPKPIVNETPINKTVAIEAPKTKAVDTEAPLKNEVDAGVSKVNKQVILDNIAESQAARSASRFKMTENPTTRVLAREDTIATIKSTRRQVEKLMKNDPIAQDYLSRGQFNQYGTYFHNRVFKRLRSANIEGLEIDKTITRPGTMGGKGNLRRPDFQWQSGTPDYEIWDIKPNGFSWSDQFQDLMDWTGVVPQALKYNR